MRSSKASGPGKITGNVNREIASQTITATARVTIPREAQLSLRLPTTVPSLLAEHQRVLLLVGDLLENAMLLSQFQELPFRIDDLLVPVRQEDPLLPE